MMVGMPRDFPRGTVTFLFTDVEGSTRLLDELGAQAYDDALVEHRRLLRKAFSGHGGVEVDTQGDAFFYAFPTAPGALDAARDGQEALASGPIRVRMGLHTGRPHIGKEGYIGEDVHLGARIAASSHGDQVVFSGETRALLDDASFPLVDLGEHRLKDFAEPVCLYQLGLERFPPLKTIANTNLPRPASSFVGREREVAELTSLLQDGARLVTLSGPGGSGKTRLAIEAAAELVPDFKNGVFWIGLSALRDPSLVTETVAQTLGAKDDLAEHIRERELLLLLDNFEQVVDAAPELSMLLSACPKLCLIVTSRELLRIQGEIEYPVPPLAEWEAVELFSTRSRLEPDDVMTELCASLDNLPLTVELAAARTSALSPAQILERLSQRLDLLRGGRDAEARQQTLRATIEWSHELLSDSERTLFAHFSVFSGGCTLESAGDVAGADLDTMQSLVEKSLLRHTNERFWMLETIREYARERLAESGAELQMRRAHAEHFLRLAEQQESQFEGPDEAQTMALLSADHDNLREALEWAREGNELEILLRLAAALRIFWSLRGLVREGRDWLAVALARASSPPQARIKALRGAAYLAAIDGDLPQARTLAATALRAAGSAGDADARLRALNICGYVAYEERDFEGARAVLIQARDMAVETGDRWMQATVTGNLGRLAIVSGDFATGLQLAAEAADLHRQLGSEEGIANALDNCGWAALGLEDSAQAEGFFHQALVASGRLGYLRGIAAAALGLAATAPEGKGDRTARLLGAADALCEELGLELDSFETEVHKRAVAVARAELGQEAFARAWEEGRALKPEEIVLYAVEG
jgi:predicted ATPase/class 3 adenylate cyclase